MATDEVAALWTEVDMLKSRLSACELEISKLRGIIEGLQAGLDTLENDVGDLTNDA